VNGSDVRLKDRIRILQVTITDHTGLPFSDRDLENVGEKIQEALEKDYDITVEDVEVKDK